jgi:3-deoxy-D-manno-octulosonic-acid transferase
MRCCFHYTAQSTSHQNTVPYRRRTQITEKTHQFLAGEVWLVDTVGEMMNLYALSDLAFVGGSLVATGGHNLLEPASRGIPCIFGQHTTNFREITALVLHYGAGIQVETAEELQEVCRNMVQSPEVRQVLGNNGLKLMRDNGGATNRHMEIAGNYL